LLNHIKYIRVIFVLSPVEISTLVNEAKTGKVKPSGSLEDAQEGIGFSFGIYLDNRGKLVIPGPTNESLASFILENEVLGSIRLSLQEELALAVTARKPSMRSQITSIRSMKRPFHPYKTHEKIEIARQGLEKRKVKTLAVIAFRYQLPQVSAQVKKAGYDVVIPDMSNVGIFDANSYQRRTRDEDSWARYEQLCIPALALLNFI
jgi:hypothetical protein